MSMQENRTPGFGGGKNDPHWWKEAEIRIEAIRKGELLVRVVDSKGKPVAGATVKVEQKRHRFRFGTAIAHQPLFDEGTDGEKYRETILRLFNCVVFENALKWAAQEWFPPDTADKMLRWCASNGLPVRGHCLLWPNYEHIAKSKRALRGNALRQAIREHIEEYVTRYRGRVYVWDVVNEAATNRQIVQELGEGILVDAYRWAREADPKVKLAYNDYGILNNRAGMNDRHRAAVAQVIRKLLDAGAPVQVLGIQGHMNPPLTYGDKLLQILDEWAKFGLPLEITEYDVTLLDDRLHADYTREFMTAVFSHPAVESFLMWGFWEGAHWLAKEGGAMFRKDWTPRPTVKVYEDLVFKQWWTQAGSQTDAKGEARFRVFLGQHEVAVNVGKRQTKSAVQVDRGGKAITKVEVKV